MKVIMIFGIVIVLAFSYSIVKWMISGAAILLKEQRLNKYAVYIWGLMAVIASIFIQDNYVYKIPDVNWTVISVSLVLLLLNLIVSRYSGYRINGKFHIINFILVYPLIEEVIFRGIMLPILNRLSNQPIMEIAYLPVTIATVITAFLFAIAHLQYYKLNKSSSLYMFWAFIGGIFFGAITDYAQSIIIAVFLHLVFNLMSVYYYNRNKKQIH